MAVRRRRPLVPPPYPRRNRYTPLSSEQSPLVSVSAVSLRLIAKTALAPLLLLFPPQTLRWFVMGALWGLDKLRSARSRLRRVGSERGLYWVSWQDTSGIVTHPGGGMCYNSVTNQVFVNFTISFTGVTLASSR